jgi:hypothetical protein
MAESMRRIVRRCFPKARRGVDRFHFQKLAFDTLQYMRIPHCWDVINEETDRREQAKLSRTQYESFIYASGDTCKQLLERSRYMPFKSLDKWSTSQKQI